MSLFRKLASSKPTSKETTDVKIRQYVKGLVGYAPRNFELFKLATIHSSMNLPNAVGKVDSNERLEFLGDAVLSAVIAEYLFKKFPFKDEGFLTEIRSRIVSRDSLNKLGQRLGFKEVIELNENISPLHKSVYGDMMEAFIGAVFLDRGFDFCKKFILNRLIEPYFDLDEVIKSNPNAKSQLIEWGQKESIEITFKTVAIEDIGNHKEFLVEVLIDRKPHASGHGTSKKRAEQNAAQRACKALNLLDES